MTQWVQQLRQRKLVQWALTYVAAGWAALQVIELLSNVYQWPPVVLRLTPILLAIGLLLVFVLAWYHGERGHQRVTRGELLLLVALLIAAGTAVVAVRRSTRANTAVERAAKATVPAAAEQGSIAVLPFVDLSPANDQEYLADGIAEHLITALSKIDGLRVPARTSAFAFKGRHQDVREIARRLNVRAVLEGSVIKSGERLRVSAQLVNAEDGYQLWSESYERAFDDVFAVQDEIGAAIVEALKIHLATTRAPASRQPRNSEAYEYYLRGRYFWNKRTTEDLLKAADAYRTAIALDPTYAQAHAALAETYAVFPDYAAGTAHDAMPRARQAALRALELDSLSVEALTALGLVHMRYDWDWPAAERAYRRALAINPNYATAHQWYGEGLGQIGRFAEAEAELRRTIAIDPLALVGHVDLAQVLVLARQYERAITQLEYVLAIEPEFPYPYTWLWIAHLASGRREEASKYLERRLTLTRRGTPAEIAAITRAIRDPEAAAGAVAVLDAWQRTRVAGGMSQIALYTQVGATQKALALVEKAVEERNAAAVFLKHLPLYDPLRGEPRFRRALAKTGL